DRPGAPCLGDANRTLVGSYRWPGGQAGCLRSGADLRAEPIARADLPSALRGGLVDGDPLAGVSVGGADSTGRTAGRCPLSALRDAPPAGRDARNPVALLLDRLALCGRAAAGRGHASADDSRRRNVWSRTAQPERRAPAPGGAVEVSPQEP